MVKITSLCCFIIFLFLRTAKSDEWLELWVPSSSPVKGGNCILKYSHIRTGLCEGCYPDRHLSYVVAH